jgi:hypothetical protein
MADRVVDRLIDLDAIEPIIISLAAVTIDRHLSTLVRIPLDGIDAAHMLGLGVDRAGHKLRDRGKISSVQRNILDRARGEGRSHARIVGVEDRLQVRAHTHLRCQLLTAM